MCASCKLTIALSFYGIRISSDYRLFCKTLSLIKSSKKTNLPVYSMIILSSSNLFLYLSPGPSLFPCPTFQKQTNKQIPSRHHQKPTDEAQDPDIMLKPRELSRRLIKYIPENEYNLNSNYYVYYVSFRIFFL